MSKLVRRRKSNAINMSDVNKKSKDTVSVTIGVENKASNKAKTKKFGFDRGLKPSHIIGATQRNNELMFLVAWQNDVDCEPDLLTSTDVYINCPQLAIKFFEDRIYFVDQP